MDQCRDMAFLLAQAEALGARDTKVFEYVLPDNFAHGTNSISSIKARLSRFASRLGATKHSAYRVLKTQRR